MDEDEGPESPSVLSIDPGGVTGWTLIQVHADALSDPEVSILDNIEFREFGQCESMMEIEQSVFLAEMMDAWEGAAVLVEDFILREFSMGRELLSPVRVTEHLAFHMYTNYETPRPMFKQMSATAMAAVTDERLKRWGLYDSKSGEHARDATRHAIIFLRKAKTSRRLRQTAWPHIYGEPHDG